MRRENVELVNVLSCCCMCVECCDLFSVASTTHLLSNYVDKGCHVTRCK